MQGSAVAARRHRARRLPPLASSLALTIAAAACAESGAAARSAVARDSAGVAIVESTGPAWGPEQAIVLADTPAVLIGAEDDQPEYQFGRVAAALRLADGGIAVFDGMAHELRWYDAQGKFVRKTGGEGGGPGEYRFVSWMRRLPGDSLMLHDVMAQRITVVAPDGTVGRTVNLAAAAPPPPAAEAGGAGGRGRIVMSGLGRWRIVAPFADGTMLARASGAPPMENSGSVARDSVVYVRLAPDGSVRDTLGTFVGDETVVTTGGSGGNMSVMVGPPPFGRTTQVAVDRDGFWVGTQDRYELRRYDTGGRLQRIVRRPVEPLALTEEDVAERKRLDIEGQVTIGGREDPNLKRMVEQRWENAKIPAAMPAHGSLIADATGHLWVRETTRPADQVPKWTVFHSDGHMLGTVAMPEDFRPLDVGADYVLGVQKDESDVEQVALYPLRPAGR